MYSYISSAVPHGSGAFQVLTCPSSASSTFKDMSSVHMYRIYKVKHDLSVYLMTLDDCKRSNQGQRTYKWLYLINGALYDQSLNEIHIMSHILPSVDQSLLETHIGSKIL